MESNSFPPIPQLPASPRSSVGSDDGDNNTRSIDDDNSNISRPEEAHLPYRPATWQPRSQRPRFYDDDDDEEDADKGAIRRSLIPDYVINYLRGETPETVAQRKAERQQQQLHDALTAVAAAAGEVEGGVGGGGEPRLRGGGSVEVDGRQGMVISPAYRRSDEPILRSNAYDEKRRRSYGGVGGSGGKGGSRQRRARPRRLGVLATHGWRSGVALHALLALLIFAVGLICLAVALTSARRYGGGMDLAVVASFASSDSDAASGAGSCAVARRVAWPLRALAALFATALLAGAQYVFQVLSSPTRAELDAAHVAHRWLDIGVPSLRNILFLLRYRKSAAGGGGGGARFRSLLALVATAVALVSAVLYGSLVNVTIAGPLAVAPSYDVLLVSPAFLQGLPFSNASANNAGGLSRIEILQLQQMAANTRQPLTNLTARACLRTQSRRGRLQDKIDLFDIDGTVASSGDTADPRRFSAVLIVLKESAVRALGATNSSVVQTAPSGSELLASGDGIAGNSRTAAAFQLGQDNDEDGRPTLVVDEASVEACLVQESRALGARVKRAAGDTSTCDVTVNTTFLGAVLGLNLVSVFCLVAVLLRTSHRHFRHAPLITLGDAVSSFLREPDVTTRGACLLSKADVHNGLWRAMAGNRLSIQSAQSAERHENVMQPMFLDRAHDSSASTRPDVYRWFRSVSLARWIAGAFVWVVLAALTAAGLAVTTSTSSSRSLGVFGEITPLSDALDGSFWTTGGIVPLSSAALLANLPHLGFALLYLMADAHVAAYFLSHESSLYLADHGIGDQSHGRKPLRVSHRPRGYQTTSLHLTVPPVWQAVLLALLAALLFVLREGIVVTNVLSIGPSAAALSAPQLVLVGFSGVGLLVLFVLLVAAAVVVLGLGLRRTPPPDDGVFLLPTPGSPSHPSPPGRNPLVLPGGSCSAVLSARCHPLPEEIARAVGVAGHGNGSNSGPLPLWLRPLSWGPVPSYHHPYEGYNRRRGLTRDGMLSNVGDSSEPEEETGEEDNIDAIVGHCTFSAGPLMPLDKARSYA